MAHAKTGVLIAGRASRRPALNKKILATAVAAAIAPVGAFTAAHAEIRAYGRISNYIDINDTLQDNPFTPAANESDTPKRFADLNGSGRFGIRYDGNVGPGLNVHARYEFSTTTDKEEPGIKDVRIATLGITGLIGRLDIGNQWSAYYNTFGTLISPTYTLGSFIYSSVGGGAYRTSNTIKYSASFGPVSAELDMRFNESDEGADVAEALRGDGYGFGVNIALSERLSLAFALDNEERADGEPENDGALGAFVEDTEAGNRLLGKYTGFDAGSQKPDEDRFGIAIKASFESGYWASFGWQNYQTDKLPTLTAEAAHPLDLNDDGDTNDPGEASAERSTARPGQTINTYFLYGGGNITPKTSWLFGYSQADDSRHEIAGLNLTDGELQVILAEQNKSEQITWGIYRKIGAGLNLYYEASRLASDSKYRDGFVHLLGMRVQF